VTKLANQPFFANAKNGDKVLIYNSKKQAILYRPSINMIIEVAPINVQSVTPTATASALLSPSGSAMKSTPTLSVGQATFALLNGTQTSGLTKKYEPELKKVIPESVVSVRGNTKGDYENSILVDVRGDKSAIAAQYSQKLGILYGALPPGESTPSSDFLIILGKDQVK
jgi:hypothetical protein